MVYRIIIRIRVSYPLLLIVEWGKARPKGWALLPPQHALVDPEQKSPKFRDYKHSGCDRYVRVSNENWKYNIRAISIEYYTTLALKVFCVTPHRVSADSVISWCAGRIKIIKSITSYPPLLKYRTVNHSSEASLGKVQLSALGPKKFKVIIEIFLS